MPRTDIEQVASLTVDDLNVSLHTDHGVVTPVTSVALEVGRGERVAIVGESGCGKSLTLKSVVGLLPTELAESITGRIQIGNDDLTEAISQNPAAVLGSRIGFVFQDAMTYLNPTMRIGKQVREAMRSRNDVSGPAVEEVLRSVGLPDTEEFRSSYPHQLSGGMRQRVLIAIALAGQPEFLFADEPTTALDVSVQAKILQTLSDLVRRESMGLLLVTHDIGVVAETCDRMYVMYAGEVVESGRVADVIAAPQHPYTQALLACVLTVDERPETYPSIPGNVPSPKDYGTGCRFASRCSFVMDKCRRHAPELRTGADERATRCWLIESPPAEEAQ